MKRAHGGVGAALIAGLVGACRPVGGPTAPSPPPDLHPPEVAVETPRVELDPISPPSPPPEGPIDPILHSRWAYSAALREAIVSWLESFAGKESEAFGRSLERMAGYGPVVDSALAAEGLPPSLRYLPIVESGYQPGAVSRASAVGLWQFMAPVARSFGMAVTPLVDERRDPVRSTVAAARYLRQLEERFGSWFLALAAYNGGPSRVDRLLLRHAPLALPSDSLYLVLAPYLPRETRDFVPKFLAAATVAENPAKYGIVAGVAEAGTYVYDEVEVPDATSLDVVARAAGASEAEIRALNPQLLRGLTPRGQATRIRVPAGAAPAFLEAYARIPPGERVTVTEHVVRKGETLSGIAHQYGIRLGELVAANPRVKARRLRIGHRLLVPLVPGYGASASSGTRAELPADGTHVVRSGESLWVIARRYGLTVRELQVLNGLGEGSILQPGDRLRLVGGR